MIGLVMSTAEYIARKLQCFVLIMITFGCTSIEILNLVSLKINHVNNQLSNILIVMSVYEYIRTVDSYEPSLREYPAKVAWAILSLISFLSTDFVVSAFGVWSHKHAI